MESEGTKRMGEAKSHCEGKLPEGVYLCKDKYLCMTGVLSISTSTLLWYFKHTCLMCKNGKVLESASLVRDY